MAIGGVNENILFGIHVHVIIFYPVKNGIWVGWMEASDILIYYHLCSYLSDDSSWWW